MTETTAKKCSVLQYPALSAKGYRKKPQGRVKYTGDISLPGMLYGAILHSPIAHARILNIDVSRA